MNQIREWLYIGKYRETKDVRLLKQHDISAMLLLAELVRHPGIESLYVAVEDGEPLPFDLLRQGVNFAIGQQQQGEKTLVACGAGISRSASFAIAALKEIEDLSLMEAYQIVKAAHPDTMPHFQLWNSLCAYYDEPIPWRELDHS
jgi:protein-tyrosine phosphatase